MLREKIKICDECKKTISQYKCKICEKDLCKNCLDEDVDLTSIELNGVELFTFKEKDKLCEKCSREYNKLVDKELKTLIEESGLKENVKKYVCEKVMNQLAVNEMGKD